EHLDPALQSFASLTDGEMCANVSAASLAHVPAPADLISGGSNACSEDYSADNSLLDVFVSGCKVFLFTAIKSTQPDTVDDQATAAGAGGPYRLSKNAAKVVTGCQDKNGATVPLDACLSAAAYSSAFQFETDRVILK